MLASPIYLVRWLMRLVRRWRFWRMAYTPAITCGFCGATIWLVGVWRCGCGFQAASHLLRPCPICGRLPRRPPKQLAHLAGINDIRIAAELAGHLSYFFACWELPAFDWPHPIIPDAVCALSGRTFAIEYDRGMEGVRFFAETKITRYE